MAAAVDVSYPVDSVCKVAQSCVIRTAVSEETGVEPYPFWDLQSVKIRVELGDVFRMPQ